MSLALSAKIGLVLLIIGSLIFLIGFCTPYWKEYEMSYGMIENLGTYTSRGAGRRQRVQVDQDGRSGLWKACFEMRKNGRLLKEGCSDFLDSDIELDDELRATQFFETVGLLLIIPAFLFLLLGACVEACKNRRLMPILAGVCAAVAAGCMFLGAIIYGTYEDERYARMSLIKYETDLSWSFALALVGGVFVAFAGAVILVGAILRK